MPPYSVMIDVEFQVKATSKDVVANRIRKMLREGKFDENNFEWSIEPVKQRKQTENDKMGP